MPVRAATRRLLGALPREDRVTAWSEALDPECRALRVDAEAHAYRVARGSPCRASACSSVCSGACSTPRGVNGFRPLVQTTAAGWRLDPAVSHAEVPGRLLT